MTFADTTAFVGCTIPKDSILVGMYVIGSAVSNAVTTATVNVGTTATATEWLAAYDVKTAATGEGYNAVGAAAVGSAFCSKLTADTPVYFKYADTGGAGTAGGWTIKIEYMIPGPGEVVNS
jgi:hypothetical protein